MATVSKVIADILKLSGQDPADAKFKDLLSISTEIPDDAVAVINSNLLTLDAAKQNPVLKAHFTAAVLNGMDATHKELYEELGFEPTLREELEAEKNTYKRTKLIAAKVKELEGKKGKAGGEDKQKYADEIAALNKALADSKDSHKKELDAKAAEFDNALLDHSIKGHLQSIDYAYELPREVNVTTANNLLQSELKNKQAKFVRNTDGDLKLVRLDDPTLDYLEDNRPVPPNDFINKTLANHKLIKVTDPGAGGGKKNDPPTPGNGPNYQEAEQFYDQQLKASGGLPQ